jgi:hypothetical protein
VPDIGVDQTYQHRTHRVVHLHAGDALFLFRIAGDVGQCTPQPAAVAALGVDHLQSGSLHRSEFPKAGQFLEGVPPGHSEDHPCRRHCDPLELEIFRSEVRQILAEQRTGKLEEMRKTHEERLSVHDGRAIALKQELEGYFTLREKYYQEYICECDGTCGTGLKGRGSECKAKQRKYEEYVREFEREKTRIDASLASLSTERERISAEYTEARKLAETAFSEGFLARLQALGKLGSLASFAITLLLMLVEITPILSKLLAPEGPYDNLVRISEHEFRVRFMRTVYQQNMHLHAAGTPVTRQSERTPRAEVNPDPTDVRNRYAELRRQLRTKLKSR